MDSRDDLSLRERSRGAGSRHPAAAGRAAGATRRSERRTIDTDAATLHGRLALLLSQGFFDSPQNGNTACTNEGIKRQGLPCPKPQRLPRISRQARELGFVTQRSRRLPGRRRHEGQRRATAPPRSAAKKPRPPVPADEDDYADAVKLITRLLFLESGLYALYSLTVP